MPGPPSSRAISSGFNPLSFIMRSLICAAALLPSAILPAVAAAADPQPTGEWRTANGRANIRIFDCDGVLWGIISWEKERGVDSENPDPARRDRPTLGLPILRAMKPTKPGLWEGEVYNADNGKTYRSRISLAEADVLRIEGCVLGFLCGGENWTRVKADGAAPPSAAPPRTGRKEPPPQAAACAEIGK
jgi:uncharacterized protein (DUF2147 family)